VGNLRGKVSRSRRIISALALSGQVDVQQLRRLALTAGHQVSIEVERYRDGGVAHVGAEGLRVDTRRDHVGGEGVAAGVEGGPGQPGFLPISVRALGELAGVDWTKKQLKKCKKKANLLPV